MLRIYGFGASGLKGLRASVFKGLGGSGFKALGVEGLRICTFASNPQRKQFSHLNRLLVYYYLQSSLSGNVCSPKRPPQTLRKRPDPVSRSLACPDSDFQDSVSKGIATELDMTVKCFICLAVRQAFRSFSRFFCFLSLYI